MQVLECELGEKQRFEALYDEYYDKVYIYIARRIRDRRGAEDLTADVFLKAFAKPYEPQLAAFSTYIFTIAGNILKNYYRDAAKRNTAASDALDLPDGSNLLDDLITREEYGELRTALTELPEHQYDVLYRRYYLDEKYKEIGLALGISENNARQLHFEAVKKLRKILKPA